jgi:hypothetical protein
MEQVYYEDDAELGITTRVHTDQSKLVVQKTWDAEPLLDYAQALRQKTSGERWGEGRVIGTVPPAVMYHFVNQGIRGAELAKKLTEWVRENPKFICFDKFK